MKTKELLPLWKEVESIIRHSSVSEDPLHAKNTLQWLLRLNPHANETMKLAAFAHDIERALPERKVKREDFPDYNAFKLAHARNSAKIIAELMGKYGVCIKDIEEVRYLVAHHETGGCERSDLIRDADSLSFFDVNLAFYAKRNRFQEVVDRCLWGYKRISAKRRKYLYELIENRKEVATFVKNILYKGSAQTV